MTYYRNLLAVAAVAIFYTGVPNYVCTYHPAVEPKYWVMGFCLMSMPLLVKQMVGSDLLKSPVVVWCFGYAWLTITWFVVLSSQSEPAWQEVRWRVLTIIDFLLFLGLLANRETIRLVRQTLVVGVLFGVALNIYEVFDPGTFSTVRGRSAGLYGNANNAGIALALGMILSVSVLPPVCRGPFILITGVGVFATFSRGSISAWLLAFAGLILAGGVRMKDLLLTSFLVLVLAVVTVLPQWDQLLTTLERTGTINKNVEERMAWFLDPSGVSDDSSWERKYLAKQAWEKVAERPFLGSGTGSSYEAYIPPHNQYLAFMQDHGLIGAAILPMLVLAVIWGARGECKRVAAIFGCTVILVGFFSHTLMNEEHTLLLLALMAAMAWASHKSEMDSAQVLATAEVGAPKAAVGI